MYAQQRWLVIGVIATFVWVDDTVTIQTVDNKCQNVYFPNCSCVAEDCSPSVECVISDTTSVRIKFDDDPDKKTTDLRDYSVFTDETYDLPNDLLKRSGTIKMSIILSGLQSLQSSVCNYQLVYLNIDHSTSLKTIDSSLLHECSALLMLRISKSQLENITFIPNKNICKLQNLILTNNKIHTISPHLTRWCTQLSNIDLTGNQISQLPPHFFSTTCNILTLSLRNNRITEFEPHVFSKCDKLEDLDLSQNSLRSLDNFIPSTNSSIRFLNLQSNHLQRLPHRVFSTLNNLEELNLNSNDISRISGAIFTVCDKLRLFLLKANTLTSFPIKVIANCTNLYTLELSDNRINSLSHHPLPRSLRYAGLANNKIQHLPTNLLANANNLQTLLLNGNQLVTVPAHLLLASPNLIKIDFSNNQLQSIPRNSNVTCLRKLDVSNNRLELFDLDANPSTFYNLSHNRIGVLMANSTHRKCVATYLDASNNEIKEMRPGWTTGLRDLRSLDVSYNQIQRVSSKQLFLSDNLENLNLAHNGLTYKVPMDDNPLPEINSCPDNVELIPLLQVSVTNNTCQRPDNCKCQQIQRFLTDAECSDNVTCESLGCPQDCSCGKVNNATFVDCIGADVSSVPVVLPSNTWVVYLENNQIGYQSLGFNHSSWTSVVYVYMRNSLAKNETALSGNPFSNLFNTKQLDLSQNSILSIQSGVFKGLGHLRHLNLSGNQISDVPTQLFMDISDLELLDLSGNKLTSLDSLSGLTQLKHIILGNNRITKISENGYQLPSGLISLDLKQNLISSLEFLFHLNNKIPSNITSVDLSHNRIKELTISMKNVEENYLKLNLRNNIIQKVQIISDNQTKNTGILEIFMETNDLSCDCHLGSLITSLNSLDSSVYLVVKEAVCQRPIFLENRNITSLDSNDLLCPQPLLCPDGCQCYKNHSNDDIQMDCSADDSQFVQLPIEFPPQIHSLYIRNLSSVKSLSNPSWNTLKEFYLIDRDTAKADFQALKNSYNIQKVEIDEDCWCRVRNYVATSFDHISGRCDQSLPPSHCIRDPINKESWSQVECTSSYEPQTSYSKIPICPVYENCDTCSCYLDSSLSLVMNCSNMQMTHFPNHTTLTDVNILDMDFNFLTILPDLSQYPQLVEVYLRNNSIHTIAGETVAPTLKFVDLDNNLLTVPSGWLDEIMKKDSAAKLLVSLLGNPLQCECELPNFSQWPLVRVSAVLIKANRTVCFKKNESHLLIQTLQCTNSKLGIIIGVIMVLSVSAIAAVLLALYFKFRHPINVYLLTHDICLCLLKEESFDDDREYEYDAFLSYSSEDSEIIVNDLLPGLEKLDFKVCVHERDWLGGQFISEQIVSSVQSSRRTIIVLSEAFLKSPWATLEFKVALQQALEDRVNRIIVVVPDKLPSKDQMDPDLRSFVTMNTYLFLTSSRFWDKLMFAMPHKKKGKAPLRKFPQDFVELMATDPSKRLSDTSTVFTELDEHDTITHIP